MSPAESIARASTVEPPSAAQLRRARADPRRQKGRHQKERKDCHDGSVGLRTGTAHTPEPGPCSLYSAVAQGPHAMSSPAHAVPRPEEAMQSGRVPRPRGVPVLQGRRAKSGKSREMQGKPSTATHAHRCTAQQSTAQYSTAGHSTPQHTTPQCTNCTRHTTHTDTLTTSRPITGSGVTRPLPGQVLNITRPIPGQALLLAL